MKTKRKYYRIISNITIVDFIKLLKIKIHHIFIQKMVQVKDHLIFKYVTRCSLSIIIELNYLFY
jgi:hypothetical protein